jgi:hypothetical protein
LLLELSSFKVAFMFKLKRIFAEVRPCGTPMRRGIQEDELPVWLLTLKIRRNRRLKK